MSVDVLTTLTVSDLQNLCKSRKLVTKGTKAKLIDRLNEATTIQTLPNYQSLSKKALVSESKFLGISQLPKNASKKDILQSLQQSNSNIELPDSEMTDPNLIDATPSLSGDPISENELKEDESLSEEQTALESGNRRQKSNNSANVTTAFPEHVFPNAKQYRSAAEAFKESKKNIKQTESLIVPVYNVLKNFRALNPAKLGTFKDHKHQMSNRMSKNIPTNKRKTIGVSGTAEATLAELSDNLVDKLEHFTLRLEGGLDLLRTVERQCRLKKLKIEKQSRIEKQIRIAKNVKPTKRKRKTKASNNKPKKTHPINGSVVWLPIHIYNNINDINQYLDERGLFGGVFDSEQKAKKWMRQRNTRHLYGRMDLTSAVIGQDNSTIEADPTSEVESEPNDDNNTTEVVPEASPENKAHSESEDESGSDSGSESGSENGSESGPENGSESGSESGSDSNTSSVSEEEAQNTISTEEQEKEADNNMVVDDPSNVANTEKPPDSDDDIPMT